MTCHEPVFPTLVRSSIQTVGGTMYMKIRGVQIKLDVDSLCKILIVHAIGLHTYKTKTWPTIEDFDVG